MRLRRFFPPTSHQSSVVSAINNGWSASDAIHPLKSLWQVASGVQGKPASENPNTTSSAPGPQGTTPSQAWCHSAAPLCSPSTAAHLQNANPACDAHVKLSSQGQPPGASGPSISYGCCSSSAADSTHSAPSLLSQPTLVALLSCMNTSSGSCSALQRISSSTRAGPSAGSSLLFSDLNSRGSFSSTYGSSRLMATTMTKTGVPNPRPEVEQAMSTHQGGHLTKRINFCDSVPELSAVVEENKSRLEPLHLCLTAKKLEWLVVDQHRTHASALEVQLIARTIEESACRRATFLSAWHIAHIVRALTCLSTKMKVRMLEREFRRGGNGGTQSG
ncbi:hypothetical protein DUNSADRAFT_11252 [Dunaliella salina]|uniref:Encoded protein n=1 Tax=Dunaliella salina TaxID=3046 RepID=A0ABQ7GDT8_DUNSA|nr:hypothetical protein DUNSADRAFT_11252 [Dunaliella salina]|eukprot:KAF5832765.1 hypothetical protein DUNSADRAFT_11252 [Dunaliella salina]